MKPSRYRTCGCIVTSSRQHYIVDLSVDEVVIWFENECRKFRTGEDNDHRTASVELGAGAANRSDCSEEEVAVAVGSPTKVDGCLGSVLPSLLD